jgi:chromosome segregation ATPase
MAETSTPSVTLNETITIEETITIKSKNNKHNKPLCKLDQKIKSAEHNIEFDMKKDKQEQSDFKFLNDAIDNVNRILSQEKKERDILDEKTKADQNLLKILDEEEDLDEKEEEACEETLKIKEQLEFQLRAKDAAAKKHEEINFKLQSAIKAAEEAKKAVEEAKEEAEKAEEEVTDVTAGIPIIEKLFKEKITFEKSFENQRELLQQEEEKARLLAEEKEKAFKNIEQLQSLPPGIVTVYLRYGNINQKYHSLSEALANLPPQLQDAYDHNRKITTNSEAINYTSNSDKDELHVRSKFQVNITFKDAIINVIFD